MAFSWGSSNNNNNNNTSNGFSWGNNNTPNSGTGGGGGFGASNNNNTNNNNNSTSFFGGFGGNNSNQQQGEGWNSGNNNNNSNNNTFSFGGGNNNNNNNGNSWSMNTNNNTNNNNNALNPNNDHVVVNPPSDAISNVEFHPNSAQFIVSSWDSTINVYEFFGGNTKKLGQQKHDKPILDCCYDSNGDIIYSAGCDNVVKIWNPQQNNFANIGQHQAPIRCVEYNGNNNMLITGSWDRTCSFWDKRNAGSNNIKPVHSVNLGFRVYAMAQKSNYLVIALSNNDIRTFDLRNQAKQLHSTQQESSTNTKAVALKKQIRCIDIFPNSGGYCAASIGGRVIIKHFNRGLSNKDFSYKCHRASVGRGGVSHVFAVNALKFHQQSSVFATAGDDGTIVTWDKDGRAKLISFKELAIKNYRNNSGNSNQNITIDRMPVVALDYHSNGQYMIYASSYNWNKGQEFHDLQQQRPQIYLHQVQQKEIDKGKK